ncbi:hypothetical protein STSP1_01566 [Sedimentisphaera salicampi]|uniref:Uncharacterized protein n=1 Tax=Sedimentisphaera salicampi TaxID=1941349 RepID=A0A1W6LMZ6_9BACT|nr:hypothetical protein STSP1_01566 [Sedimentisphaera salicampi]
MEIQQNEADILCRYEMKDVESIKIEKSRTTMKSWKNSRCRNFLCLKL